MCDKKGECVKLRNRYEVRGDVTVIFCSRRDGIVVETIVDTSQLERLLQFDAKWYARIDKHVSTYYIVGHTQQSKGYRKSTSLHRWLMGEPNLYVDHINHDTQDNRLSNLRTATNVQNLQNRSGIDGKNTSGYRGVSYSKMAKKWQAYININKKRKFLGYYATAEEAAKVAETARRENMTHYTGV